MNVCFINSFLGESHYVKRLNITNTQLSSDSLNTNTSIVEVCRLTSNHSANQKTILVCAAISLHTSSQTSKQSIHQPLTLFSRLQCLLCLSGRLYSGLYINHLSHSYEDNEAESSCVQTITENTFHIHTDCLQMNPFTC